MYYFFSSKLIYWQDEVVRAILTNEDEMPHEFAVEWLYGRQLSTTHEFTFSIPDGTPLLDNYLSGTWFSLYSEKLINLFRDAKIRFDLFPANIVSRNTETNLGLNYKVFRLLEISDCLDESKSIFRSYSFGKRQIRTLIQPSFTETFLKSKKMLTRIAGQEELIIIHSELKKILEDEKISGCDFALNHLDETILFDKG